jgi:hypothetical protein
LKSLTNGIILTLLTVSLLFFHLSIVDAGYFRNKRLRASRYQQHCQDRFIDNSCYCYESYMLDTCKDDVWCRGMIVNGRCYLVLLSDQLSVRWLSISDLAVVFNATLNECRGLWDMDVIEVTDWTRVTVAALIIGVVLLIMICTTVIMRVRKIILGVQGAGGKEYQMIKCRSCNVINLISISIHRLHQHL